MITVYYHHASRGGRERRRQPEKWEDCRREAVMFQSQHIRARTHGLRALFPLLYLLLINRKKQGNLNSMFIRLSALVTDIVFILKMYILETFTALRGYILHLRPQFTIPRSPQDIHTQPPYFHKKICWMYFNARQTHPLVTYERNVQCAMVMSISLSVSIGH